MKNIKTHSGFTILEVMVALAIIGISIGIFFSLIGNSSKLKGKIDDHSRLLLLARTKTEEAILGILGKDYEKLNEKKSFGNTTADGIKWQVLQIDKYKEAVEKSALNLTNEEDTMDNPYLPPKGTKSLTTQVEGIKIETLFFFIEKETENAENQTTKTE